MHFPFHRTGITPLRMAVSAGWPPASTSMRVHHSTDDSNIWLSASLSLAAYRRDSVLSRSPEQHWLSNLPRQLENHACLLLLFLSLYLPSRVCVLMRCGWFCGWWRCSKVSQMFVLSESAGLILSLSLTVPLLGSVPSCCCCFTLRYLFLIFLVLQLADASFTRVPNNCHICLSCHAGGPNISHACSQRCHYALITRNAGDPQLNLQVVLLACCLSVGLSWKFANSQTHSLETASFILCFLFFHLHARWLNEGRW